ncbi:UNVERIFIED_CONTAM: hypothetical protein Sindi_2578400 [Sesamum indicum]
MVITGYWIDESWLLQKRVLNFVHIPPPRQSLEIANAIWRCLEDWDIDGKIHTISVDNASTNDSATENLKIYVKIKGDCFVGEDYFTGLDKSRESVLGIRAILECYAHCFRK